MGFVRRKEKALADTAHLISAELSRLQQHREGKGIFFFFYPPCESLQSCEAWGAE